MIFLRSKLFSCVAFVSLIHTPWAFPTEKCENTFLPVFVRQIKYSDFVSRLKEVLQSNNLTYIGDVVRLTEQQLLEMPGIGKKLLEEIKQTLSKDGLHLNMEVKDWPPRQIREMDRLGNELALLDIEKKAKPDEIKALKELWIETRPSVDDPYRMMHLLRTERNALNDVEAMKREWLELEATRVLELDRLSPGVLRDNMNDLDVLREHLKELENLKARKERIDELEELKEDLEPKKVEKLDPIFAQPVHLLAGYTLSVDRWPSTLKLLKAANINHIGDLVTKTKGELFEILKFSKDFLSDVEGGLFSRGLRLNMQIEGWPPNQEKMEELKQIAKEQEELKKQQEQNKKQKLEYVFILPIQLRIRDAENHNKSFHVEDILRSANISRVGDLITQEEQDLLNIPGIGQKTLDEIKYALSAGIYGYRLSLGVQIEDWPPSQEKIEQLIKVRKISKNKDIGGR